MKLRFKCTASRPHTHQSIGAANIVTEQKVIETRLEACGGEAFERSPSGTLTFVIDRAGIDGLKENAVYDVEITEGQ